MPHIFKLIAIGMCLSSTSLVLCRLIVKTSTMDILFFSEIVFAEVFNSFLVDDNLKILLIKLSGGNRRYCDRDEGSLAFLYTGYTLDTVHGFEKHFFFRDKLREKNYRVSTISMKERC